MIAYVLFGIFCVVALGFFLYYIFVKRFFSPYPQLLEEITNSSVNYVDDALDGWLRTTSGSRKTMVYLKKAKQWRASYYKNINNQVTLLGRLRFREYIILKTRGKSNAFTFTLIHHGREFVRDGNVVTEEKTRNVIDKQTYSEDEIIKRIKELHYSKGDGLFNFVNHSQRRGKCRSNKNHHRKHTHKNKR